jgi:hypothetical protein
MTVANALVTMCTQKSLSCCSASAGAAPANNCARRALRNCAIVPAAVMPCPAMSPISTINRPSRSTNASYQSPPTLSPAAGS